MKRRNAQTHFAVLLSVCLCSAVICLIPAMPGAQPPLVAAQPAAPADNQDTPTPSPSDAPPPVVEPKAEPAPSPSDTPLPVTEDDAEPVPSACSPVVVDCAASRPTAAPCRVVRCRRFVRRCRPRIRCRRRFRCCPCTAGTVQPAEQAAADPWKDLFDGKSLKGWKSTEFGGEGKVEVRDGMIVMEMGSDMSGITFTGDPPRNNYEIQLQGQRLNGHDFFCTTTFPVGKEYCSLVVGGWGGTVVGLSNVDFYDASDNLTTTFQEFKDKTWYSIRIRVSDHKITAWIDDEKVVEQPREGHKFDIRFEVDPSRPLGISTWQSSGAVRNIRVRPLKQEEIDADRPEDV